MTVSVDARKTGLSDVPPSTGRPQQFGELLDFRQSVNIALLGDSTGNATDEWFYLFGSKLATDYPTARVEHLLWNDTNQSYDAATVIQAAVTQAVVFNDTFTTDSADVYGRTPDTGDIWGRDGSSASGDWSTTTGNLVRSSDATVSTVLFGATTKGDQKVTLTGMDFSTVGDGVATRIFRVPFQYVDGSNYLYFDMRVTSAGVVTLYLFKLVAGVSTLLNSLASPAAIPGSTASVTGTLVLERAGLNVTATFGASTFAGTIVAADATALLTSTKAGLVGGLGNLVGMKISETKLEVTPTTATVQTIKLYNGSFSGSTLAYQLTRLATMLPVAPDAVFVSSSHNYTTTSGATYYATVEAFCQAVLALYIDAALFLCSQNPQKSPSDYVTPHAERCRYIRRLATDMAWGYIPVYEDFLGTANWQTLVQSDGVHPTVGTPNTGQSLWRDAVTTFLAGLLKV